MRKLTAATLVTAAALSVGAGAAFASPSGPSHGRTDSTLRDRATHERSDSVSRDMTSHERSVSRDRSPSVDSHHDG